jgi:hypothetical protein
MASMRLVFDFDNTLISYDQLFFDIALKKALVPANLLPEKNAVRDHLRQAGKEDEWTRLQGEVYGAHILEAIPYPGMLATLRNLSDRRVPMFIVSHKTRTPFLGHPWDLHQAAKNWLELQGFHAGDGLAFPKDNVFFELTKEAKVARMLALRCTHCVDDLPEILEMLPDSVEKIHFAPSGNARHRFGWKQMSTWNELPALLDFA